MSFYIKIIESILFSFFKELLAIITNRIYKIMKIVPKFTISQVAQSKSNSCKKF